MEWSGCHYNHLSEGIPVDICWARCLGGALIGDVGMDWQAHALPTCFFGGDGFQTEMPDDHGEVRQYHQLIPVAPSFLPARGVNGW